MKGESLLDSQMICFRSTRPVIRLSQCPQRIIQFIAAPTVNPDMRGRKVPQPPGYVELPATELNRFLGTYTLQAVTNNVYPFPRTLPSCKRPDATILLVANFDYEERLAAVGERAGKLVTALLRGNNSGLAAVGLGDPDAQRDIYRELTSLGDGRDGFKEVSIVGTYVAGLLEKFDDTIMNFSLKRLRLLPLQWDGQTVVRTDFRCPHWQLPPW